MSPLPSTVLHSSEEAMTKTTFSANGAGDGPEGPNGDTICSSGCSPSLGCGFQTVLCRGCLENDLPQLGHQLFESYGRVACRPGEGCGNRGGDRQHRDRGDDASEALGGVLCS